MLVGGVPSRSSHIDVALQHVPPKCQWNLRSYGIDQFRHVGRAESVDTQEQTIEPE